ncbi:MAG: autotransporter assembly complex family protein [Pseudomonadota bacterium]
MALARTKWAVVPAICLGLAAATTPALGFELFGVRLFGGEKEPPPPDAVTYDVTFDTEADRSLTRRLVAASRLEENKGDPSPGAAALLATARGDYQRLLAVLYADGRYGGTISITVDGREAADIPIDATFGDEAEVEISVNPGPVYLFDNVSILNRPGPIAGERKVPKTPEELGLRSGAPARSGAVIAAEGALVGRWREKGHPKARIAERTATAYHDDDEMDVAITVDPGRSAVFGGTTVTGTEDMDPAFVAWYAGIKPGEPFTPEQLERARDQLRRLEVFQAQRIVEADAITSDGTLPIEIQVAESKRRVFGVGAKYSTLDGAGLEGYWRHRNLFGRAEKLQVEGRVGGINSPDPDEYNYRLAVNFLKPGVFTPYTDFSTTVFAEQIAPDTYRSKSVGARAGFSHRIGKRWTVDGFAKVEAITIDRTTVGDGDFLMFSLPTAVNYDGSNDRLNPTKGFRAGVKFEPFYEARFSNVAAVTEVQGSVYQRLGTDRVVLAARGSLGSIAGAPLQEIPASRLFFAGGGGSIRGYPYRGVGPRNSNGEIIGGRSYFTGSVEARVQVTDSIGLVPFLDFGNAYRNELPDFSEPLKYGAGLGLRYFTGLGPLRFDVAFPLQPFDGDPNVAFYIGLGQAF